jgi:hypothetical protein
MMQFTGITIGFIDYCPRLRVGGTAVEAVGWISDSTISGKVAAGTKATLIVDITVAKRRNYLSKAASYDVPVIVAPRFSYFSVALLLLGASPVMMSIRPIIFMHKKIIWNGVFFADRSVWSSEFT